MMEDEDPRYFEESRSDEARQSHEAARGVEVPYTELAADLLHAVIESFVLREGTDYGEQEHSLQDKVARVVVQLKRGEARIVFDPESDSVTILTGKSR